LPPNSPDRQFADRQWAALTALLMIAKAPDSALDPNEALAGRGAASSQSVADGPSPARAGNGGARFAHLPGLTLMVVILTIQAALSARLLKTNTALGDEALGVWAGHLEWAHWLHDASTPAFHSWFSGAPEIYPPLAALADSLGGLTAVRILSLCFMLAATCLLWGTARRLHGKHAGYYAAGLFAFTGPTLYVGVVASSDAMSLFLLAVAAWCACGATERTPSAGWLRRRRRGAGQRDRGRDAFFDRSWSSGCLMDTEPGGKSALRRGALLVQRGAIAVIVLRIGGSEPRGCGPDRHHNPAGLPGGGPR
jgi:hypothetical protein